MGIKENAMLVSLSINKPKMTEKDAKATKDAEAANNAYAAGQYRKNLYPKHLIQPILSIESSARAYLERAAYSWGRGEFLLPTARFMQFADIIAGYEVQFNQAVTAFLNNWANVMREAQQTQGDMFDPSAYPDLSALRDDFRFRVAYKPVSDASDFRVQMQDDEVKRLKSDAERAMQETLDAVLKEPLRRLRDVVAKLSDATGKEDRLVVNKRTGHNEVKPPIFRDSIIENIIAEIGLLQDFSAALPDDVTDVANIVASILPESAEELRCSAAKRRSTSIKTKELLASIDAMLE